MKIARAIESFYPFMSGPANQAFYISRQIMKHGAESKIFTTFYRAEDAKSKEKIDGIEVERFGIKASLMKYLYTPAMREAIIDYGPHLIHAHNYRSYQTELGHRLAKRLGIPLVINTHGSLLGYQSITKGLKKLPYMTYDLHGKKAVLEADAVVVNSRQEYEEAIKFGVDKRRLNIIPMGIDLKKYMAVPKQKTRRLILLFVGRITRDRNLMPILEALKMLDDKAIELRIVGPAVKRSDTERDGYMDELMEYVMKNRLQVDFRGPKYGDDLIAEYRAADIFIYTSMWENFGQTILEAAAAGLPVIATNVGIAPELLEKKYIVSDSKQIARRIKLLDTKERMRVRNKLQGRVKKDFSWEKISEKYYALYKKVLK